MYREYLETYFNQYMTFSDNQNSKLGNKYDPVNLFFVDAYNYGDWFKNKELTDKTRKSYKDESVDLSDKSSLEVDEEKVKEEKRLKILILNKLLTRLPLLAQIKA